jgi:hypothetical protein
MRSPSPLSWIHPVASRAPKEQRVQWLILTALAVLPIVYFFSAGRGGRMAGGSSGDVEVVVHRPKVILFGDSLTERSFDAGGWGAALAHNYSRKVRRAAGGRVPPTGSRAAGAGAGAASARAAQIPEGNARLRSQRHAAGARAALRGSEPRHRRASSPAPAPRRCRRLPGRCRHPRGLLTPGAAAPPPRRPTSSTVASVATTPAGRCTWWTS